MSRMSRVVQVHALNEGELLEMSNATRTFREWQGALYTTMKEAASSQGASLRQNESSFADRQWQ